MKKCFLYLTFIFFQLCLSAQQDPRMYLGGREILNITKYSNPDSSTYYLVELKSPQPAPSSYAKLWIRPDQTHLEMFNNGASTPSISWTYNIYPQPTISGPAIGGFDRNTGRFQPKPFTKQDSNFNYFAQLISRYKNNIISLYNEIFQFHQTNKTAQDSSPVPSTKRKKIDSMEF